MIRLALPLAVLGALPGCGDSPETLLAHARESVAAQDYQGARLQLASALLKAPENAEMLALMAQVQLRLGDADAAQGLLQRLERAGGSPPPWMQAEVALLQGRPGDALSLLGRDASTAGWRVRAEAQLALDEEASAVRSFEQGMAAGDDVLLAASYARYRLNADDTDGAGRILRRMRAMAPKAYETLVLAADLAAARGRDDDAIAAYRQAADAYPDRVAPLLALANAYDGKGDLDTAGEWLEKARALAPADPDVDALRFQLMAGKGEWEKIRLALQGRESKLQPGSALQMTYAEALLRLGYAQQARILFNRAALALPGNPYSRMMLGEAQLASGDADGAWATLAPLAASTLARPEVLQGAEKAARAAGAPEADALRARLEPGRLKATMALVQRGESALARQDWAGALDVYGELLKRGDDPEVFKRLALASSRLGRAGQAITYADRTLAASPDNPDYLYLAGLVRLEAGQDLGAARRLLEAAAAGDPRNPVIARDLRKAKAAAG